MNWHGMEGMKWKEHADGIQQAPEQTKATTHHRH